MEFLPASLSALQYYPQFILYKIVASKSRENEFDKLPVHYATGELINAHNVANQTDVNTALSALKNFDESHGLAFVFADTDPFWFLDLDNCLNGTELSDTAKYFCEYFAGAAIEISCSGTGLHIFGAGEAPPHSCRNRELDLEFYTSKRFVALTGHGAEGDISLDFSGFLPEFINDYFPATGENLIVSGWTTGPVEFWNGPEDDDLLIFRALRSQSRSAIFGGAVSFADLWDANVEVLSKFYPDTFANREYDESSADAALAQHLAFWTGNNCARMESLMRKSKLVRDKWGREDYLPRTILNACARQAEKNEWLSDKPTELPVNLGAETPNIRGRFIEGNTILNAQEQLEIFKGCVYILDEHKILTPGGHLLKPEQFRATYGGYTFVMDKEGNKLKSNAWEAFTESSIVRFPRAVSTCFRPDLPPSHIIQKDGRDLANIWHPIEVPQKGGDASPFIIHLKKLYPNDNDFNILLGYLAALVQFKGVKFPWCPVLQGTDGNGKTLVNKVINRAIGDLYSHSAKASELSEQYNDWLYKKIFIAIDDIYIPNSKREVIEILKPWITEETLEIRAMYSNKVMRDVCCNFILNTNDKAGIPKNRNDRRFAPLYSAQQNKEDLERDGMTGVYFQNLYGWLIKEEGYAITTHYLLNYKIPDKFNPAFKKPAPITSSTDAAIEQGIGGIEQYILEEIEQGMPGFKNGWVSSTALEKLLEKIRASQKIPLNRRREIMISLGYDWHPALKDGRVNTMVLPDANKPRLYVANNNPHRNLKTPTEVCRAYSEAQM